MGTAGWAPAGQPHRPPPTGRQPAPRCGGAYRLAGVASACRGHPTFLGGSLGGGDGLQGRAGDFQEKVTRTRAGLRSAGSVPLPRGQPARHPPSWDSAPSAPPGRWAPAGPTPPVPEREGRRKWTSPRHRTMRRPGAPPGPASPLAVGGWWARALASSGGQRGRFAGRRVRGGRWVLAQRPVVEQTAVQSGSSRPLPGPHRFVI